METKNNIKKITIVTAYPTQGAGSGTLITAQARTYIELGYDVTIVTANNNTGFDRIPGVKYVLVPFTGEKEPIQKLEGALPFNFVMFTSHTNSSENFDNITISQLEMYCSKFKEIFEQELKENKPDIFHGQHCWISTALLTEYGVPVVTTIHGTDLMGYENAKNKLVQIKEEMASGDLNPEVFERKAKYEFYIKAAEKAARNSKKIFVISHQQERKFKELFPFAADKVVLVRNGCDRHVFYPETPEKSKVALDSLSSNITDDGKLPTDYDKLCLFVGKFARFKRVDLVLKAAKIYEEKMLKKGKKVMTLIVGSGALDDELRSLQRSLELKNTHFVGRQNSDVVRALQTISDVFLAPSDEEPDGLVYKECLLCGNIPIGTNSGGVPDTLNPENKTLAPIPGTKVLPADYGVMVPMNDAESLADAAMYVMDNPNLYDREKLMNYAEEHYDQMEISRNVIIPLFNEATKSPEPAIER